MVKLVCTSCIQAAEDEDTLDINAIAPADLCISLGAQMDAHDCIGKIALTGKTCACAYLHDNGLKGNDPIRVLELGRTYARTHGHNAVAAEGMHRAICRALDLLAGPAVEGNLSSDDLLATYNGLQAEKEANTNCLEGIRCPKCGSHEPFYITCKASVLMHDASPEWDNDSDIVCVTCQHTGIVSEFQQNLTAGEIMYLEAVIREEAKS